MKKYILEASENDEGLSIKSNNDGFYALELIGILEFKIQDIRQQMAGEIKPTVIERIAIKEDK